LQENKRTQNTEIINLTFSGAQSDAHANKKEAFGAPAIKQVRRFLAATIFQLWVNTKFPNNTFTEFVFVL